MAATPSIFDTETAPQRTLEAEREELDWLLTSGALGRSANVARVLKYICEESFAGRAEQIKEYNIAVEALGRRPNFDSQTDTIVRVTAHSLRKRLVDIYATEGASRPMRVVIPPGHYVPTFLPVRQTLPAQPQSDIYPAISSTALEAIPPETYAIDIPLVAESRSRARVPVLILFTVAIAIAAAYWFTHDRTAIASPTTASTALPPPQDTIRALMGPSRKPYTDRSGLTWTAANYCQGGTNVEVPPQRIASTGDPFLYFAGVRGIAHCIFPVNHGLYEIHLHFAETSDLPAATRVATFTINAGPTVGFDVVDQAGGNAIATSTVVPGVAPEIDGAIHLDFISEVSPLNAVEILPAPSTQQLPVRIVASPIGMIDAAKNTWLSDRYFIGGRPGQTPKQAGLTNLGMYGSDRVGRFRYNIPVVPLARYRVVLYFREPWFGKDNGSNGGPGSRIFDVACNGATLLKNFDILAESGSAPIVKTFEHVQASSDGRIDLTFLPVVNYPVVNAIEILPEN